MPVERWNDRELQRAIRNGVAKGMRKAAKHVRDEVRKDLSGPAGSEPGQPPGKVTGDLRRAVRHKVRRRRGSVTGVVGVLDEPEVAAYAARLAGGFAGRDRLGRLYSEPPRPFLAPVIRRESDRIVELITQGGFG